MTSDLTEVELVPNLSLNRSGLKTYGYLLSKYGFNPTKPGPFTTVPQLQGQSNFRVDHAVGRKATVQNQLRFKDKHGRIGKVPASVIQNDVEWLCPVKIGTHRKVYNLNFDTGSADLWLWSTELPATVDTSGRHLYNPAKSSTFKRTIDSTWRLSYNDNSTAAGTVGTDLVNLGGLKIKNQTIELANELTPSFQSVPGDGLLGLAFGFINHVSPLPVATPPENLAAQGNIAQDKQLFTAYLSSYRDAKDRDHKSFYTFGFIDKKALRGQAIHYADVDNSQGFWQFQSPTASIGDRQVVLFDNTAVADTGSSLALIDDSICSVIYDTIPGARYEPTVQGYIFPSNTTLNQLPVVKFAVGDQEFAVQKEDLAYADVGEGFTYGGIQSRGDLSFDVLGDTFLKSVYSIFDQGNSRFGVVVRKDSTQLAAQITPRSQEMVQTRDQQLGRRTTSSSDSTSLGIRGYSSVNGITLVYGSFILLLSLFSSRGSVRLLLAGLLCLCLLQ